MEEFPCRNGEHSEHHQGFERRWREKERCWCDSKLLTRERSEPATTETQNIGRDQDQWALMWECSQPALPEAVTFLFIINPVTFLFISFGADFSVLIFLQLSAAFWASIELQLS